MGTHYNFDRNFSDIVHNKLAIPLIYNQLGWIQQDLNINLRNNADLFNAVDYFLIDSLNNKIVTVQERFRESKYRIYNDFTIRFEREYNPNENRKYSEYYKLDADYFVYGIINDSKFNVDSATDFIKFAVINLMTLKNLIDEGKIIIDRNLSGIKCVMINGVMHCPVNQNKDRSSSFIPIDIEFLIKYYYEHNLILISKGF